MSKKNYLSVKDVLQKSRQEIKTSLDKNGEINAAYGPVSQGNIKRKIPVKNESSAYFEAPYKSD